MSRGRALGLALVLAVALAFVLLSRPAGPGPAPVVHGPLLHVSAGTGRVLPPALLGINGEAIVNRETWSSPQFLSAVAGLHAQALRVFGGNAANYWDWRTGTYLRSPRVPGYGRVLRPRIRVTVAGWARAADAAGAVPVFDLNVLTSTLTSQLAMLRAARRAGMKIRYVELGNELYLPPYAWRFPTGAGYGRLCTRWIAALHRAFPGVQVAADAYPGVDRNTGSTSSREQSWNAGLLRTLRGASALTLHAYFSSGLGPGASLTSPATAARLLRAPARRWAALSQVIAGVPPRLRVWVTEWNLFDTLARVHGSWAQGLAVAAFGIDLVTAPRVVQSDFEALVDSAPFAAIFGSSDALRLPPWHPGAGVHFRAVSKSPPPTPLFGLSAGGVGLHTLLEASASARLARALDFGRAPVRGVVFASRRGFSAVFVNLSDHPYTLPVPSPLRGHRYTELWGRPITLVAGAASLHRGAGKTGARFGLEPFSLLEISS